MNIVKAISAVCFTAVFFLFVYWFLDFKSSSITGSPSGWWWFGCLLVGIFTSELDN